jgi:hypothetical protein
MKTRSTQAGVLLEALAALLLLLLLFREHQTRP